MIHQFRYSLRVLLIAVTGACILLAIIQLLTRWFRLIDVGSFFLSASTAVVCSAYMASLLESDQPLSPVRKLLTMMVRVYFGVMIGAGCGLLMSIFFFFLQLPWLEAELTPALGVISAGCAVVGAIASVVFHIVYQKNVAAS